MFIADVKANIGLMRVPVPHVPLPPMDENETSTMQHGL